MINKNELRLGNIVSVSEKCLDTDTLILSEKEYESLVIFKTWDRIFPIPLTEGWLNRFGFVVTDGEIAGLPRKFQYTTWEKGNIDIDYFESRDKPELEYWFCYTYEGKDGQEVDIEIKSVHQLQNLYFSLTGDELILN
jgi:hypothetical protein